LRGVARQCRNDFPRESVKVTFAEALTKIISPPLFDAISPRIGVRIQGVRFLKAMDHGSLATDYHRFPFKKRRHHEVNTGFDSRI